MVSPVVLNVADPEVFRVAVPICVPLSINVTVPVGVPVPDAGATVAVNVTFWPKLMLAEDAASDVVVDAGEVAAAVNTKTVAEYAAKL